MRWKLFRLLNAEQDPRPSGGGVPAPGGSPAPQPTPTPAPGASPAPAPAIAPEAIANLAQQLVPALASQLGPAVRDFVMGEVRRSGALGGGRRQDTPPAAGDPPAGQPAPQPAGSGLNVQDIMRVTAFTAATAEHNVPALGVEMLLPAFMAEAPRDPRAWVAEKASSLGWKPNPSSQPTTPAPAPAGAGTPAPSPAPAPTPTPTPGGPPPTPAAGLYQPPTWEWPQAEVDAFVKKNGAAAFMQRWRQEVAERGVVMPKRR
jgi:hypothetical protein